MGAKGKEVACPILGAIGSSLIIITVLIEIDIVPWPTLIFFSAIGVLSLVGTILGFVGKTAHGVEIMLAAGIVGIFLMLSINFFLLMFFNHNFFYQFLLLFTLIGPFLVLLGGILGSQKKRT